MHVRQLPRTKDYRAWLFKSFEAGVAAMRQMMQSDIVPATVRLSDEDETRSFFALRAESQGWKNLVEQLGLQWINARGYSFDHGALMILGFEDWPPADRGSAICKAHGAFDLGHGIANAWLRDRYETPYLRDVLIDHGVMVDTLETATTWANLPRLHKALAEAIAHATQATGARALVMTHVSHCYRDGASLYVTFLARMARTAPGRNLTAAILTQWQAIKRAATDCIMANGGTLSHHHGVGSEHAAWMNRENGAVGMQVLREFKHALDPHNVMNPGKWLDVQRDPNDTAIDYNERFWNLPTR
jgi:alkyldihydroxyacetonephosphate synthase